MSRAQSLLQCHCGLWRQVELSPVDVGEKCHRLVGDTQPVCQRGHLEPAGVRRDGTIPSHKPMESARLFNQIYARTQCKVIGVADHNLPAQRRHIRRRQRLDAALCGHGQESGSLNLSMRRDEDAGSRSRNGALHRARHTEIRSGDRHAVTRISIGHSLTERRLELS